MSIKSYKYRFYPTPKQEQILAQTFGCVRYVYNRALRHRTDTYKNTGKGASFGDTSKKLTSWKKDEETAWLKDVSCVPLQQCLRHLNTAFGNFFSKRSRYPSLKKKSRNQSAEFTKSGFKWDARNRNLTIAKMGRLNIRWSRQFKAEPTTVTISRTPTGKYFVSIRIDEDNRQMPEANAEVGIDMGIAHLATDSDGKHIKNIRTTRRYAAKLARAQRILSRRVKGSNRWNRARIRVANIHEKIAAVRLDWTHKKTTEIVKTKRLIVVEDLRVSNMIKNRKLAKSIADCSWFEFRRQLEYKSAWYGRQFVAVPAFNTSRTCSECGHCEKDNRQTQDKFECLSCGHIGNADVNAAINILAAGRAVVGRGAEEDPQPVLSGRRRRRRSVKQLEVLHS